MSFFKIIFSQINISVSMATNQIESLVFGHTKDNLVFGFYFLK